MLMPHTLRMPRVAKEGSNSAKMPNNKGNKGNNAKRDNSNNVKRVNNNRDKRHAWLLELEPKGNKTTTK